MRLLDLFENEKLKTAVIGWGRMNPPTIGHGVLIDAINDKAKQYGGDPMLFLTMSHLDKGSTKSYLTPTGKPKKVIRTAGIKNPLDWKTKLGYAQKFFKIPISTDPSLNTIMSVMKHLETKGYEKVVLVCGSDRVKEFETQVLPYNNTPDKAGNINFNIKEVSVEEGGFRDEEADDASGMSASKMREAAALNDFESFKQGVPVPSLAKQMFDDVREGLGFNYENEDSVNELNLFKSKIDNSDPKLQDPDKLKVLNYIASRTDGKEHFLSFYKPGTAFSGNLLYVDPITAKKFLQRYDDNVDYQPQMRSALTSVQRTANLFKTLNLPFQIKKYKANEATLVKPMGGNPIKARDPNAQAMQDIRRSGASGAHRDKKKEFKQGKQKHKGKIDFESVVEGYHDMEVMGHKYMPDLEDYDDNRKIWHTIVTPQGKTVDADFTPYSYMDKEDLKLYIKLGYPKRQGAGPLNKEDLQKMANAIGIAKLDPEMANAGKTNEEEYDTQRDKDAVSGKPRKSYFTPSGGKKPKNYSKEKAEKAAIDAVKKVLGK
jgi:hypothetical protein